MGCCCSCSCGDSATAGFSEEEWCELLGARLFANGSALRFGSSSLALDGSSQCSNIPMPEEEIKALTGIEARRIRDYFQHCWQLPMVSRIEMLSFVAVNPSLVVQWFFGDVVANSNCAPLSVDTFRVDYCELLSGNPRLLRQLRDKCTQYQIAKQTIHAKIADYWFREKILKKGKKKGGFYGKSQYNVRSDAWYETYIVQVICAFSFDGILPNLKRFSISEKATITKSTFKAAMQKAESGSEKHKVDLESSEGGSVLLSIPNVISSGTSFSGANGGYSFLTPEATVASSSLRRGPLAGWKPTQRKDTTALTALRILLIDVIPVIAPDLRTLTLPRVDEELKDQFLAILKAFIAQNPSHPLAGGSGRIEVEFARTKSYRASTYEKLEKQWTLQKETGGFGTVQKQTLVEHVSKRRLKKKKKMKKRGESARRRKSSTRECVGYDESTGLMQRSNWNNRFSIEPALGSFTSSSESSNHVDFGGPLYFDTV